MICITKTDKVNKKKNHIIELNIKKENILKQIEALNLELGVLELEIDDAKINLADEILKGEPIEKFVRVKFENSNKTYDYIWDEEAEVKPGYEVAVETRHGMKVVEVVEVFMGTRKDGINYSYAESL